MTGSSGLGGLLREIDSLTPRRDIPGTLEVRGQNAFAAVRKLIELIEYNFEGENREDLIKRFFNASRTNDYRKFQRGIERVKKAPEEPKK